MTGNGSFIVMEEDVVVTLAEQHFNRNVREWIITMILSILLGGLAYLLLGRYKKKQEREELYGGDKEDEFVYRISVSMCTFSLATSFAAILLLPGSVIGNEIVHRHPENYYYQWLTNSLVQGLWNKVFLCSNLSLFIFLPFTYLFMESSGFSGSRQGITSRLKETAVMLFLLGVLVNCVAWLLSSMLGGTTINQQNVYDTWSFYLPYLYSWISMIGCSLLLVFTPLGFAILFTEVGKTVMKPQFFRNIDEELHTATFEVASLERKLRAHLPPDGMGPLVNGAVDISRKLKDVQKDREKLEKRKRTSTIMRNLSYPVVMIVLSVLTAVSIIMVGLNILEIVFDRKSLPAETDEKDVLGAESLSAFGLAGVICEIIIIFYILIASLAGLYSLCPRLRPQKGDTDMTKVVYNCAVLLILSSALPVVCVLLGISNFDLLGAFGRQDWLANFYLILSYNIFFGAAATVCLVQKFSASMRQAIYNKIKQAIMGDDCESRPHSISMSDSRYFD